MDKPFNYGNAVANWSLLVLAVVLASAGHVAAKPAGTATADTSESTAPLGESTSKLAIPDMASQAKSLGEVQSDLVDDYANLPRRALARKLLSLASEPAADRSRRYVLLVEAQRVAVLVGDGESICNAADAVAQHYQGVDATEMKIEAMGRAAKVVAERSAESLGNKLLDVATDLAQGDQFERAQTLIASSLALSSRLDEKNLFAQATHLRNEIGDQQKAYAESSEALAVLAKKPLDPEANLIVGKYIAVTKGDWDKGLPMLAKGSDTNLKAAATLDLMRPADVEKRLAVADKWWDQSKTSTGVEKFHIQQRSAHWYRLASADIRDKLALAKVQKKLKELADDETAWLKSRPGLFLDDLDEIDCHVAFGDLGKHGATGFGGEAPREVIVGGLTPTHALSTHPSKSQPAHASYRLDGKYRVFTGVAALADTSGDRGSPLMFNIIGDGRLLWTSPPLVRGGADANFRVDIRNVKVLKLEVECPGSFRSRHAVWVNPQLLR